MAHIGVGLATAFIGNVRKTRCRGRLKHFHRQVGAVANARAGVAQRRATLQHVVGK